MQPSEYDGIISAELERSCAHEAIHLLGTVQPHGFLMVVEAKSEQIVQISSGITRHWPGLLDANAPIATPLSDWVDCVAVPAPPRIMSLSTSHPVALPWRV
jgi:hypothetical protein